MGGVNALEIGHRTDYVNASREAYGMLLGTSVQIAGIAPEDIADLAETRGAGEKQILPEAVRCGGKS